MVKYVSNSFLASKVALFNEYYDLCQQANLPFETVRKYVLLDKRVSPSHTSVPGENGAFGFGGHCFPKYTAALTFEFNLEILEKIIEYNKKKQK